MANYTALPTCDAAANQRDREAASLVDAFPFFTTIYVGIHYTHKYDIRSRSKDPRPMAMTSTRHTSGHQAAEVREQVLGPTAPRHPVWRGTNLGQLGRSRI